MICILHGYLLEGSGSNLWTRSVIQSLCRQGETVHLMCQENHPEIYDFIASVYFYRLDGSVKTILERDVHYSGHCIMHKPEIGKTLPVYVWDRYEEFSDVQPMINLSDEKINFYLDANVRVLKRIISENRITVLHVNHAVLMSVVAQMVSADLSLPFAIMPHGSALEYAVKKDHRFFNYANKAFTEARRIFVIGKEIRQRVNGLFPDIDNLNGKMIDLNLGVDTSLFEPISQIERAQRIDSLCIALKDIARGKNDKQSAEFIKGLRPDISKKELLGLCNLHSDYNAKQTDFGLEKRLQAIDWNTAQVILFVGRLIASKGIHLVLAALPLILEKYRQVKLVIVGHGPLREPMEALLHALEHGHRTLFYNILDWGTELEGSASAPFMEIKYYLDQLEKHDRLESYFEAGELYINLECVIFTGYLTHKELRYLFPACDVAIFPSIVAEAGPLVFLEAIASGCFPIGTYFAGMAASIDSVSEVVPGNISQLMKLHMDKTKTVSDIVQNTTTVLGLDDQYKQKLRQVAIDKYDWQTISKKLADNLYGIRDK